MIYIVEDDANIRELVTYTLQSTGFEAEGFENGELFFRGISSNALPELVLLDIMLPGDDGLTILKKIRNAPDMKDLPVIMMTAKGGEYDKVVGLDSGADDYITKPFGMMELVSRVKALLRRAGKQTDAQKVRQIGELCIDYAKHKVTACGKNVELTYKEFQLLRMLTEGRGNVLTRDQLLSGIWGYEFDGETRTVDVHVRTLRQKLGICGKYIETVRGVGYRMGGSA